MNRRVQLGVVHVIARTGHIVVKVQDPNLRVRMGSWVEDSKGRRIGRLVDLIGSVESPYAVVKPVGGAEASVGETVYIVIPRPKRGAKGGRRKKTRGRPGKSGRPGRRRTQGSARRGRTRIRGKRGQE